jgi:hypothetical protein
MKRDARTNQRDAKRITGALVEPGAVLEILHRPKGQIQQLPDSTRLVQKPSIEFPNQFVTLEG